MKQKITLFLLLLISSFGFSQTNTFTGLGNWELGSNWSLLVPPTSAHDVVINGIVCAIADPGAVCNSLTINSGQLIVSPEATLTVTGGVTQNATLIIGSDATNSGSVIAGSYSGSSATYQRYLTGGEWHLLSTPLSTDAQTIANFVALHSGDMTTDGGVKYSLGTYDNAFAADGFSTWKNYTSDVSNPAPATAFPAGVGYEILMNSSGTVDFTGDINTTGATVTITENVTGWNLIGNPFPSSINGNINADANNFLSTNSGFLDPSYVSMYIWNPSGGGSYDIINQASAARYLPPGQAFFVKREPLPAHIGGADVLFATNTRVHQTTNIFQKTATETTPTINLTLDNNSGTVRNTEIKYMNSATLGLDPGYDAGQFAGVGTNDFNLYTQLVEDNGVKFALQVVPDTDYDKTVIPLGITAKSGTQLTFKATATNLPTEVNVYLEDKLLDKVTEINQTDKSYTINLSSDLTGTGRFYLHTLGKTLSIDDDVIASNYKLAISAEQQNMRLYGVVTQKGSMNIFDTFGRKIFSKELQTGTEQDISLPNISTGIYIVKFNIDNKSFSKKVLWN